MEHIYIVLTRLRKGGDWHSLYAFKSLQDAEDYVIENQRQDERVHACCWQYKIDSCGLQL